MLAYLIIAALMGALIYLLYRQGLASSKCITAVLFVFRPGRQADSAFLDSCTGWDPACRALSSEPDIRVSP